MPSNPNKEPINQGSPFLWKIWYTSLCRKGSVFPSSLHRICSQKQFSLLMNVLAKLHQATIWHGLWRGVFRSHFPYNPFRLKKNSLSSSHRSISFRKSMPPPSDLAIQWPIRDRAHWFLLHPQNYFSSLFW